MRLRHYIGAAAALTVAISVVGALAGPLWRPKEQAPTIASETPDTRIGGNGDHAGTGAGESGALAAESDDGGLAAAGSSTPVGTYEVASEIVEIEVGPVTLKAVIRTPVGATENLSAVVFLHGAGTHDLNGFAAQAEDLASAGVVTVVPGKRTDNYTTAHRDYHEMAADYTRSIDLAASLPGVTSVGIYAESEGAYAAPIMAADDPRIDFVILVSAPIVTPNLQSAFAVDSYLNNVGVPSSLFRVIPRALGAAMPFGMLEYAFFDPAPYQQRMTQPTMLVFGTADASMPYVHGTELLISDLAVAGNDAYTVRFYEGANHGIRIGGPGSVEDQELAPGFVRDLADWIHGLPATGTAAPRIAGAQPHQQHRVEEIPAPPAVLSGDNLVWTHAAAVTLLAGGAGAAGVQWALRRRRAGGALVTTHRMPRDVARLLAGAGIATTATWVTYALYLKEVADLAFNYQTNPLFTFGAYTGQQLVAFSAATLLAAALVKGHQRKGELDAADRAVFAANAGGSLALLVLAAYWSGFPDIAGGLGW